MLTTQVGEIHDDLANLFVSFVLEPEQELRVNVCFGFSPRAARVRERKVRQGIMENNVGTMCYHTSDCSMISHRDTTTEMFLDKPVTKKLHLHGPLEGGKEKGLYLPRSQNFPHGETSPAL